MRELVEEWKPIMGYEGVYEVSNLGRVKSLERVVPFGRATRVIKEKLLKQVKKGTCSYYSVNLPIKGKQHWKLVHRLVAQAFLPNPNNYTEVNHKDENKENNSITNLEWCDREYNHFYGTARERQSATLKMYYLKKNGAA
jgi:hypothetical protein